MAESESGAGWKWSIFGGLIILAVAYLGNYHIMYGSTVSIKKLPKVSWSMSETLINVDAVGNMPAIAARAQYPLFLMAIERAKE